MRQAQSFRILAFIEGTMERLFVNRNFTYVHVVTLQNGSGWDLPAMIKQIKSNINVVSYKPDHIVVWFDRESDQHSSAHISECVKNGLLEAGVDKERMSVFIPDRMTENMILADEKLIMDELNIEDYNYMGDGINGKRIIKDLHRKAGKNYKETFHGVNLLKKTRLSNAAMKSESARSFLNELKVDCWWK